MNIGDTYEICRTVTPETTADAVGSGGLLVFGTPFLIAAMENAAFTLLQKELPEGKTTVGTKIEISHDAPTPVGMRIWARAEITAVSANGKLIDFAVSARDEAGPIGGGTHQRAVVDLERFLKKCESKRGEAAN